MAAALFESLSTWGPHLAYSNLLHPHLHPLQLNHESRPASIGHTFSFFCKMEERKGLSYILRVLDAVQNTLDKCRSHSEMYFGEDPSPLAPAASLSGAVVILWLATEVDVMCWWSIKPMASIELTAAAAAAAAKATEV